MKRKGKLNYNSNSNNMKKFLHYVQFFPYKLSKNTVRDIMNKNLIVVLKKIYKK